MEFARSRKGIFVTQQQHVLDLFSEIGFWGCKAVETLIKVNLKLQSAKTNKVNWKQYQRLVGKLIY